MYCEISISGLSPSTAKAIVTFNFNGDIKTSGSRGLIINDEFHIIGGYQNGKHVKWNEKNKQFDVLHDVSNENDIYFNYSSMVTLDDRVLVFGYHGGYRNKICEYNISENKWRKFDKKMPNECWRILGLK